MQLECDWKCNWNAIGNAMLQFNGIVRMYFIIKKNKNHCKAMKTGG